MIAKQLENTLGVEYCETEADMVQRFQLLREANLLPRSRGKNAEALIEEQVVAGLLSIVSARPGFAAQTVRMLTYLRPVGGPQAGFAGAVTFGEALVKMLRDAELLKGVLEIRISDSEIYTNSNGRAAVVYRDGDECKETYYVRAECLTLLQAGAEKTYDPRDLISYIIREIVVLPGLLIKISNEIKRDREHQQLMERPLGVAPRRSDQTRRHALPSNTDGT